MLFYFIVLQGGGRGVDHEMQCERTGSNLVAHLRKGTVHLKGGGGGDINLL